MGGNLGAFQRETKEVKGEEKQNLEILCRGGGRLGFLYEFFFCESFEQCGELRQGLVGGDSC